MILKIGLESFFLKIKSTTHPKIGRLTQKALGNKLYAIGKSLNEFLMKKNENILPNTYSLQLKQSYSVK